VPIVVLRFHVSDMTLAATGPAELGELQKSLRTRQKMAVEPQTNLLDSEAYRKSAQAEYGCCENLSIDADAPVEIDAQGAWVQAGVWVPKITLTRTDKSS
jgi:hypothetical protein